VPQLIGAAVSTGKATLYELQTVYGLQDVYDLLEVVSIDAHNMKKMTKHGHHH